MPTLIFGVVVLVLLLWAANVFAKADTSKLVRVVRPAGGIGALALAVFLGARGEFAVAVPLGFAGLSLLGWLPFGPAGFGARTSKTPRQVSRVRSAFSTINGCASRRKSSSPNSGSACRISTAV